MKIKIIDNKPNESKEKYIISGIDISSINKEVKHFFEPDKIIALLEKVTRKSNCIEAELIGENLEKYDIITNIKILNSHEERKYTYITKSRLDGIFLVEKQTSVYDLIKEENKRFGKIKWLWYLACSMAFPFIYGIVLLFIDFKESFIYLIGSTIVFFVISQVYFIFEKKIFNQINNERTIRSSIGAK